MGVTHSRAVLWGLGAAGVVLGTTAAVLKAADGSHPVPDVVLTTSAGALFVAAGLFAAVRVRANPCGPLMVLVGLALFAEDLQLSQDPVVFTAGLLVAHVSTPLVLHLVLAFPDGRLEGRAPRALVAATYIAAVVLPAVGTPFVDWAGRFPAKPDNLLLIVDAPGFTTGLLWTMNACGLVIAAGVLVALLRRWRARPALRPVLVMALAGAACSAVAAAIEPTYAVAIAAYKVAFCLWPLTFTLGIVRTAPRAADLTNLLLALRGEVDLRELLARTLHDRSLRLGEWDPVTRTWQFRDENGELVTSAPGERTVTLAWSENGPIAAVLRRDTTWDDPRVLEAAGTVVRLVTEHQRKLDADRARLAEARRTGVRLVELADAERQRVERDLHDGAQQRLVVVALGLRMAQQRLDTRGDPELAELLASTADGLDAAIVELRDLARGIHPVALTQGGLVPAVTALIERTPLPVELASPTLPRFLPPVEATAYFVVAEAITNALKHSGATSVTVTLDLDADRLHIRVCDNGIGVLNGSGSGIAGLADRVRALEGHLRVEGNSGVGTAVHATIPVGDPLCAT
ncbi:two-component sensor histidine kinase [Lentzea pudingi]|uniref:histidine kinase n=1 Tax=Lentzea pudingi TaxID=1789439 RepID=A0ABQ2HSM4_9PSEU|nr:histidine kinase [Lentzea pudingi]GGM90496.1 two-component sensor histidine kinase [Lentzea pudingi]